VCSLFYKVLVSIACFSVVEHVGMHAVQLPLNTTACFLFCDTGILQHLLKFLALHSSVGCRKLFFFLLMRSLCEDCSRNSLHQMVVAGCYWLYVLSLLFAACWSELLCFISILINCCNMELNIIIHPFIHFWHAPLWVRSARHRHHSPEWVILSHVDCFVQGEVHWFQVLLGIISISK